MNQKGMIYFANLCFKILDHYKDWKALSIGEEKRFQNFPTHKNHFNLGQISHKKVLDHLSKSEIAIIPSRWEEPFGRTALEASSRGCATIISNSGGLPETTEYAIKLKKLDVKNIENETLKLIKNFKLRKTLQVKSTKNVKHKLSINSRKIDKMRELFIPIFYINSKNKNYLNIYNIAQKLNHRIYNLSLEKNLQTAL